ncbi:hypothetical protein KNE206_29890 [Kitasatospora sp. NE20-6]|uniref:PIN domain-containing protein n=1 Tax=Kitasatospora sp. NE20-6 TaxID=2859066 RepID=UPI0034DC1C0B
MIVFDTSTLFGLSPDDPKFDLLRALKKSGQQKVGIPWMVREELVAQKVLRHADAHKAADSAITALNRTAPWLRERNPSAFDADAAKRYWRQKYGTLFEIIETSGDVALQALAREANCEKPAKGSDAKAKAGARDAAIWLSVIDYLKNNPTETVHFASANTSDFGKGGTFPSPMAEDLEGLEERLVLLTSFDEVVEQFSTPLDIDEDFIQKALSELLASEETLSPLESAVKDLLAAPARTWVGNSVNGFLTGLATDYTPVRWNTWISAPNAIVRRVQDVSGHKIGDEEWYTATVDWILVGFATLPTTITTAAPTAAGSAAQIACQWRTKLLFSSRPGEVPTILQSWAPTALDPAEKDEWEPIVLDATASTTSTAAALGLLIAGLTAAFVKYKSGGFTIGETAAG